MWSGGESGCRDLTVEVESHGPGPHPTPALPKIAKWEIEGGRNVRNEARN